MTLVPADRPLRARLNDSIVAGDRDTVAAVRAELLDVISEAKALLGDADTALLDWCQDGPLELDGLTYRRVPDRKTTWNARGLLAAIVADYDGPPVLTDVLLAVLPGTVSFRVGKPGEEGVRSLGMNPDDWSTREVVGVKLEVKQVGP